MKLNELIAILKNFELKHGNIDIYFDYDEYLLRTPVIEHRRKGEPFNAWSKENWFYDYDHDCGETLPEEMITIS